MKSVPGSTNHKPGSSDLLHTGGAYEANLRLARLGTLPFFVIAAIVVALWAWRCMGWPAATAGTLAFTLLPPVLAHAGLATLDMAMAAFVGAALLAFQCWIEKPSVARGCWLGLFTALAMMSKFSAIVFLLAGFAFLLAGSLMAKHTPVFRLRSLASLLAAGAAWALTIWAVYRFSLGPLLAPENHLEGRFDALLASSGSARGFLQWMLSSFPIPAMDFFWGLYDVFAFREGEGHLAYFLGQISKTGWWYFYPVLVLVKTPLPFLILVGLGVSLAWRRRRNDILYAPVLAILAILLAGIVATPNNGLRQVLPVYPLLSVMAGCGVAGLLEASWRPLVRAGLPALLVIWLAAISFHAHPDYLAYFNALAGSRPELVAVDSDLDWGQDLKRLNTACQRRGIRLLHIKYNGSNDIDLARFGLPELRELKPGEKTTGWVAISALPLALGTGVPPYKQYAWLREQEPVERIGSSIFLYWIPEP